MNILLVYPHFLDPRLDPEDIRHPPIGIYYVAAALRARGVRCDDAVVIPGMVTSIGSNAIEIIRWDERFTSKMAQSSMIESGMKKKERQNKANLDIISAALLEFCGKVSYADRRSHAPDGGIDL